MTATVWQWMNCGNCLRCLAGGRVHGPYPTHYVSIPGTGKQTHLYGAPGGKAIPAGTPVTASPPEKPVVPESEKAKKKQAENDADELVSALSPGKRGHADSLLAARAELRRIDGQQKPLIKLRRKEAAEKGETLSDEDVALIKAQEENRTVLQRARLRKLVETHKAALKEPSEENTSLPPATDKVETHKETPEDTHEGNPAFVVDGVPVYRGTPGPLAGKPHLFAFGHDAEGEPVLLFCRAPAPGEKILERATGGGMDQKGNALGSYRPGDSSYPEGSLEAAFYSGREMHLDKLAGDRGFIPEDIKSLLRQAYPGISQLSYGRKYTLEEWTPPPPEPPPPKVLIGEVLRLSRSSGMGRVRAAVKVMGEVHSVAGLPRIPIGLKPAMNLSGHYKYNVNFMGINSDPVEIKVNPSGNHHMLTTAHEVGHFLDHAGFGGGSTFGTYYNASQSPEMRALRSAMRDSAAYAKLEDMRLHPERHEIFLSSPVTLGNGEIFKNASYVPEKRVTSYYLKDKECFARAYAQWVAVRSGDPEMLRELNEERAAYNRATLGYPVQWEDDDFAPIGAAMDALFASKGWLHQEPQEPHDTHA